MDNTTQAPEIVDPQAKAIAAFSATESGLATLKETYGAKVYDCTTNAGDGDARHARIVLRDTRVNVEKFRQQLKAPLLEEGRIIDAEAKRITAEITALEDPIDAQIKAEEKRRADIKAAEARAEAERLAKIDMVMRWLRERPGLYAAANVATLSSVIAEITTKSEAGFEHYGAGHETIAEQVIATLKQLETMREARIAADAESERLRLANIELARKQREMEELQREMDEQREQLAAMAAEQAAARAEAQAIADEALLEALDVKVDPVVEAATDNGFLGLAASLTPKADAMEAKVEVVAKAVSGLLPVNPAFAGMLEAADKLCDRAAARIEQGIPPAAGETVKIVRQTPKLGDGETLLQVAREAHLLLVGLLPGHTTTIKLGNVLGSYQE